jgi:hypothetical protein
VHSGFKKASLDRVADVAVFYRTIRNVAKNNTDSGCAHLHLFCVYFKKILNFKKICDAFQSY